MTIRTLDKHEIASLYDTELKSHFPPSELKRLDRIHRLVDQGLYRVAALFDNDRRNAYAFTAGPEKSLQLLDYFAVRRSLRGQGVGSRFLHDLKKHGDATDYMVEVECADAAADPAEKRTRRRRIDFYLQNGARMTPVRSQLFGETFRIMVLPVKAGIQRDARDVAARYRSLYRRMFPEGLTAEQMTVTIAPDK